MKYVIVNKTGKAILEVVLLEFIINTVSSDKAG
jgi:hypothetical protein